MPLLILNELVDTGEKLHKWVVQVKQNIAEGEHKLSELHIMDTLFEEVHQMMEQIRDKVVHIDRAQSMFDNMYSDYIDLKDLYVLMIEKGPTVPMMTVIGNCTAIDRFYRASLTFKLEVSLLKMVAKQRGKFNRLPM
jgi:hypothetical protein